MMMDEKQMMKNDMVAKLAMLLIDDGKASSMTEALDIVINSETYQRLINDKAGLYYQVRVMFMTF